MSTRTGPNPSARQSLTSMGPDELAGQRAALEALLAEAHADIERLRDVCTKLVAGHAAVVDEIAERELSAQPVQDWAWLLQEDGSGSRVRDTACRKALEALAVHRGHPGLYASGYNPETNQRVVRVAMLKDAPELTRKVQAGLELVLPFIEMRQKGSGNGPAKHISVFEHTLSEHASFSLVINEAANLYILRSSRYGSDRTEYSAANLAELLGYVASHCYYKLASELAVV